MLLLIFHFAREETEARVSQEGGQGHTAAKCQTIRLLTPASMPLTAGGRGEMGCISLNGRNWARGNLRARRGEDADVLVIPQGRAPRTLQDMDLVSPPFSGGHTVPASSTSPTS